MDKEVLGKWLKSGYIDGGQYHETREGTPQGGIISPTLLTLTLRGFETAIKNGTKKEDQVNVVVYADDFIISARSKEILEATVKPIVKDFRVFRGMCG